MDKVLKAKKSQLRNVQTQELKLLEKELKKKKGNAREELSTAIEEVKRRHEKELEDFEEKNGVARTTTTPSTTRPSQPQKAFYFPPCNWEEVGKKRLEVEASKRGLGKSGNKEELVTKLIIFQAEQKKKVDDGLIDINNVYREEKPKSARKAVDVASDDNENSDRHSGSKSRNSTPADSSHSWKKNDGASKAEDNTKKGRVASSSSSESDESSSEESSTDGEADEVVPDGLKQKGREGDSRGVQKRTTKMKYNRRGPADRNKDKNNKNDEKVLTEEEHQFKRERMMAQVLVKLLEKNPDGVLLDNIGVELKKLKVTNFRPELLGYDTTEEWIVNQPPQILHYDHKHKRITPGRNRSLPHEHD